MKKGVFLLPELVAFVAFVAIIIIFGIILIVLQVLNVNITKELVVNIIHEPVSTQDALMSLMETRGSYDIDGNKDTIDITFNKALVYAVYENTMKPELYYNSKKYKFDIQDSAKKYLDYVYDKKKYKLFLYNPETKEERVITQEGKDDDFKLYPYGKRDSIPIKPENFWLVLYVK